MSVATFETQRTAAAVAAKVRLEAALSDRAGQPIVEYGKRLIDWVMFGERPVFGQKPAGSPTDQLRRAVASAVNDGLREVYGSENDARISVHICTRRDVL